MTDVSVQTLRSKVDQFLTLKQHIKDQESIVSELNKELKPIMEELDQLMESMNITRFDGSLGKVNRVVIDYVSNPQTDEDREAFHQYLKSEGIFDDMVGVHYQKLNSFYKDKLEQAVEHGEALHIPGLEPKQRVEIRKGR